MFWGLARMTANAWGKISWSEDVVREWPQVSPVNAIAFKAVKFDRVGKRAEIWKRLLHDLARPWMNSCNCYLVDMRPLPLPLPPFAAPVDVILLVCISSPIYLQIISTVSTYAIHWLSQHLRLQEFVSAFKLLVLGTNNFNTVDDFHQASLKSFRLTVVTMLATVQWYYSNIYSSSHDLETTFRLRQNYGPWEGVNDRPVATQVMSPLTVCWLQDLKEKEE